MLSHLELGASTKLASDILYLYFLSLISTWSVASILKDTYELAKEQTRLQYSEFPITKKAYPEMSYDELLKHRLEYVNNYFKNNNKK